MNPQFWNERYASVPTVYGEQPNEFFRTQLSLLTPGKIVLPAEGEGRNAVFAAGLGWKVTAFDFSVEARKKALALAARNGVSIHYTAQDIESVILPESEYDLVALIFVHLAPPLRTKFHRQVERALKPGGRVILEAFSKNQIRNDSGGPRDTGMLYSLSELLGDFNELNSVMSAEESVELKEGPYHQGRADVVRLVAVKNQELHPGKM